MRASRLQRYSPWRLEGISPLLRLILTWGLLEGVRSGFYGGYLPLHVRELGLTYTVTGTAFTLHLLADSFGRGIGGYLVQRFGLGIVTVISALVGGLALMAVPSAKSALLLFALSAVWGLSLSAIMPGMMTLSSRQAMAGREARALTLTQLMIAPWIGVGWLGIGQVTKYNPELALQLMLISQGIALVAGVSLIFRPEHIPPTKQEYYPWQRLLMFLPAAFGQTFGLIMIGQYIQPYARELGLGLGAIVVLLMVGGGLAYGLLLWTGRYADRRSPKELLIVGLALIGLGLLLLTRSQSFSQILLVAVIAGLGMACFGPAWNALVIRLLPENNRAAIWGTLLLVEGLGNAMGPLAGGILAETRGIVSTFYVAGGLFLLLSLFYTVTLWKPFWRT